MIFSRLISAIIPLFAYVIFYAFGIAQKLNTFQHTSVLLVIIIFSFVLVASYYKIKDDKVSKHFLLSTRYEIVIREIVRIEAVTVKKFGYFYIKIGKTPGEDYYVVHLKRGGQFTIDAGYRYRGENLGRYLHKKFRIPFKEIEKIKYFH